MTTKEDSIGKVSKYPAFACSCCGFANGDMFYDYYYHLDKEPTEKEIMEFEAYRKMWYLLKEALTPPQPTPLFKSYKHSDKTRAKISATLRNKSIEKREHE